MELQKQQIQTNKTKVCTEETGKAAELEGPFFWWPCEDKANQTQETLEKQSEV